MIVKNPTNTDLSVQINGHQYSIPAKDQISGVSAVDAAYWVERLHTFIELEEEAESAPQSRKAPDAPQAPAAVVEPVEVAEPQAPAVEFSADNLEVATLKAEDKVGPASADKAAPKTAPKPK